MNDNEMFPAETLNVSTRGVSFIELGWDREKLDEVRRSAEQRTGQTFDPFDWARCRSLADVDRLVAKQLSEQR